MIDEAVILAGGFGTRLSHVLGNVPKPMAPVYGKPFLTYLLDRLVDAGFRHVVLATGHMHRVIEDYFGSSYRSLRITSSCESTPLLTGGAVLKAAQFISSSDFLVLNGDTLFDIDFQAFADFHLLRQAPLSVALRNVPDTARYGSVTLNGDMITAFREKADSTGEGLINGGIYAVNKAWLLGLRMPAAFSFEKELMQPLAPQNIFRGLPCNRYFIDIGVPDDYFRAQREFPALFPPDNFLFLDRDGVLNRHIINGYVLSWQQFQWLPQVLPALARLAAAYNRIFVVSNQQCVGKGLLTRRQLDGIHSRMLADIAAAGGRIDRIYVCTDLANSGSTCRKPATGMAQLAAADFPEVDFSRSVMVGDSLSDMQFGYRCGMRCVFVATGDAVPDEVRNYTDILVPSLPSWTGYSGRN